MRIEFRVKGRVQGVGFRAFVRGSARALGVAGWVRNDMDGTVCGVAEGTPGAMNGFHEALRRGHSLSRVTALDWIPLSEGESLPFPFEIRP